MQTQVLFTQENRKLFMTPWKEEFRNRVGEVLKEKGAEAPLFDRSLPDDYPGVVVERSLVHVAVLHDEDSAKMEYNDLVDAVVESAGLQPGSAVKLVPVTKLTKSA